MKVFDSNVPAPLRRNMPHHEVRTAREMGWQGIENGDLLREVEAGGFDVMVTGDKNLSYQHNLAGRHVALVELGTIRWSVLRDHTAPAVAAVDQATPGSFKALPDPSPPRGRPRSPGPHP